MSPFIPFLLLLLLAGATTTATPPPPTSPIGLTYNPTPSSPSPEQVVAHLQRLGITSVSVPSTSPSLLRALAYTNISILLTLPNSLIPSLSSNASSSSSWLLSHVLPFYPRSLISTLSLGHDPLSSPNSPLLLLPALRNLHLSLHLLGLRRISVSSTFSFLNSLPSPFPPSSSSFLSPASDLVFTPLLQFLSETNSSFLISLRPYQVYLADPDIPLSFALFQESPFGYRDDPVTGVRYRNLYDAMLDSVITAMAVAGHENIPVVVAETGWPCAASGAEVDASAVFAEMYVTGLVRHLKTSRGTPLRSGLTEVFVYEMFDSHGYDQDDNRSWGVFYPNLTTKYEVDFVGSEAFAVVTRGGRLFLVIGVLFLAVLFA